MGVAVTPQQAAIPGAQAAEFGKSVQSLGNDMGSIAMDMQKEANALRVDDAINKAKEQAMTLTFDKDVGFQNQRGINALERQSGKPLAEEYGETLQNKIGEISAGLGNDAQRLAFQQRSNDLLTSFKGQAIQHEATQFREYALSVREGTIANRMQEITLNYNNPAVISDALTSIQAATYDQARLLGKSAEWAEAQSRKMTSNALVTAIGAAVDKNDIMYADGLLKKYSKQMDGDDLLRVGGIITKEVDNRVGLSAATNVVQGYSSRISTSDGDRAWNILKGAESGGKQFKEDGTPLTSGKGAVGVAQVMPTTGPEAAKLAGLQWKPELFSRGRTGDPTKDAEAAAYNEALGRAYFTKQLQDFGGNLAQAYAAYNAGPGATRTAIKEAEKDGTDWLTKLPAETQKYVAGNMKAYTAGQGNYQKPTLQDIHNTLRQDPALANNPTRLKTAIDESTRQFNDMNAAIKQREEEGVANAMRGLVENGGRWSDLAPALRMAVPPKEIDNVMNFGARVAKGDDITDKALYQKLATDNGYLMGLSDNAFYALRSRLSDSDFKEFARERAGKPGKTPDDLNTEAINSTLNDNLRMLKIDPTPKDGSDEAARVGAIRKTVRTQLLLAQQQAGKKFTDAETSNKIQELFAKNQAFRSSVLGVEYGTSQQLLSMDYSDIPGDIRDNLKKDLKGQGISDPSKAQVLEAYWQIKFNQRR